MVFLGVKQLFEWNRRFRFQLRVSSQAKTRVSFTQKHIQMMMLLHPNIVIPTRVMNGWIQSG